METLLIGKDVSYALKVGGGDIADASEISSLDNGALACIQVDGTLIDDGSPAITDPNNLFYIALGRGANLPLKSMPINAKTLKYRKVRKVSPVAEVERLGHNGSAGSFNFPSPLVVGSSAGISITRFKNTPYRFEDTTHYDVVVETGDTADTIIAKIVAKINADADMPVTAAVIGTSGGGTLAVTLTGDVAGEPFNGIATGIIETANIARNGATGSTACVIGVNIAAQIVDLEEKFKSYLGIDDTYMKVPGLDQYVSQIDSAIADYTTYVLTWTMDRVSQSFNKAGALEHIAVIAIPSAGDDDLDATDIGASLDAILAAVVA